LSGDQPAATNTVTWITHTVFNGPFGVSVRPHHPVYVSSPTLAQQVSVIIAAPNTVTGSSTRRNGPAGVGGRPITATFTSHSAMGTGSVAHGLVVCHPVAFRGKTYGVPFGRASSGDRGLLVRLWCASNPAGGAEGRQ